HVADPERVAFDERRPWNRRHREQRERQDRARRSASEKSAGGENGSAGRADEDEAAAAEHLHAPADLFERHHRIAKRLVLGDEEVAADEPLTDDDAAENREAGDRQRRVDRNQSRAATR